MRREAEEEKNHRTTESSISIPTALMRQYKNIGVKKRYNISARDIGLLLSQAVTLEKVQVPGQ